MLPLVGTGPAVQRTSMMLISYRLIVAQASGAYNLKYSTKTKVGANHKPVQL
jgi:hypothetical protein